MYVGNIDILDDVSFKKVLFKIENNNHFIKLLVLGSVKEDLMSLVLGG